MSNRVKTKKRKPIYGAGDVLSRPNNAYAKPEIDLEAAKELEIARDKSKTLQKEITNYKEKLQNIIDDVECKMLYIANIKCQLSELASDLAFAVVTVLACIPPIVGAYVTIKKELVLPAIIAIVAVVIAVPIATIKLVNILYRMLIRHSKIINTVATVHTLQNKANTTCQDIVNSQNLLEKNNQEIANLNYIITENTIV